MIINHRKIAGFILVLSLVACGISFFFSGYGVCINYPWACSQFFLQVRSLLFVLFLPLIILSSILLFLRREIFIAWAKFAIPAFPIMLVVLLYTYNNGPTPGGFGLAGLISDEMLTTAFLPALFFIASLVIIIAKSYKLCKSSIQPKTN